MTKRFRVHDWVKFSYSEIREYIGEGYTDKPLRNDKIVDLLNNLIEENEQLKKEKENWKSSACSNANFNSILLNELSIAQEQGYKVSNPFKELMKDKGDDRYD